jgi:hypothetical protein
VDDSSTSRHVLILEPMKKSERVKNMMNANAIQTVFVVREKKAFVSPRRDDGDDDPRDLLEGRVRDGAPRDR